MAQLFIENLTVIDFSYACAQRGIVGASWMVDIVLDGDLDEQGMVFDFGDVKKSVKHHIDEQFDHKLWLTESLPHITLHRDNTDLDATWQDKQGRAYRHKSPADAVVVLKLDRIDTASLAPIIAASVQTVLPPNVKRVSIVLREETINGASYCYTHGLQKHEGNCQRIAHGHRSRIEVYNNGTRDNTAEAYWAEQWCDIYLASRSHIINTTDESTQLRYQAQQGLFELTIPNAHIYIVDIVTTVENIAEYLAQTTRNIHKAAPGSIQVRAFEGIGKGAISIA